MSLIHVVFRRPSDKQNSKEVVKAKQKANLAVKVGKVVGSRETNSQRVEANAVSNADKCDNNVHMDFVHSP